MLDLVLEQLAKLLLALRYRVRVRGLEQVLRRGRRGILLLPNHPGLIDPVILMAYLHGPFRLRALADKDQIDRPVVRWLAGQIGIITMPDIKLHGPRARDEVRAALDQCAAALRAGDNLLLYPSGHIYRTRHEKLRGNSGAHDLVNAAPDARVVLVRTRGLWGSSLSMSAGEYPRLGRLLWAHIGNLLRNYLFFLPRREVTIDFFEPADLPRRADRRTFNAYLERFYNRDAPPNLWVPYDLCAAHRRRTRPDPSWERGDGALTNIPATTRALVTNHLCELAGVEMVRDDNRLAEDLGLDSLARVELLLWLAREFGSTEQNGEALRTVGDVLLAARGQSIVTRPTPLRPPPAKWFRGDTGKRIDVPPGKTLADLFLAAARRAPGRVIVADQISGARTYRDVITAILALRPTIAKLAGERIGIMLPTSVAATITYWATMFAGKVPVMVNWTTGTRNMVHALDVAGVKHVLTAAALVGRIEGQGTDLSPIRDRLVLLESLGRRVSRAARLAAAARARVSWRELDGARVADTATILVTSGSESTPKLVPLTHANLLANIRDVIGMIDLRESDRMIGFLPPFHSFGLTVTVVAAAAIGLPIVYHANPTEALTLARLIAAYRATIMLGTPTFLSGILRAAPDPSMLSSLRVVVTGAEKCPEHTYAALARACPRATVLEGYGITECSPIVAVNRMENPVPGTVGKVLPSLEYALVDPETTQPTPVGERGLLLVRGPSVFGAYLGDGVASPFVEHDGKQWYQTGDLLSADADGVLTFCGRLKRFVKLGGEMISLPAIEAALAPHFTTTGDEAPSMAVVATSDETRPELVLFATQPTERTVVNRQIRAAGLSPLHNISQVVQIDEIPLLGNGKTDYRALAQSLGRPGVG